MEIRIAIHWICSRIPTHKVTLASLLHCALPPVPSWIWVSPCLTRLAWMVTLVSVTQQTYNNFNPSSWCSPGYGWLCMVFCLFWGQGDLIHTTVIFLLKVTEIGLGRNEGSGEAEMGGESFMPMDIAHISFYLSIHCSHLKWMNIRLLMHSMLHIS